jgi:hypothetical protein
VTASPGPMSGGYGCGRCREVFGTVTGFDAHQVRRYNTRDPVTCKPAPFRGYVRDERGIWRTPEGRAQRDRNAARLARISRARAAGRDGPGRIDQPPEPSESATGHDGPVYDLGLGAAIETVYDPVGDARRLLGLTRENKKLPPNA